MGINREKREMQLIYRNSKTLRLCLKLKLEFRDQKID